MKLSGKTAIVTGGARRVGRAIARELKEAGARVIVHHHGSPADPEMTCIQADLREPDAAARVIAAAGHVDILVNSAADYQRTPLSTLTDEAWDSMLALNLTAPMRLIRAAVPAGVSSVVNIVDVAAWQPWPNWLAYSTSKAALLHLTRCLAVELAPRVRVNAVAPGTVAFPEDWDAERRARMEAKIPLGRAGTPEDVARAVRFLCEEDYLTGVCLPVDGGSGLR
jgi:pteridine reductase